VLLLIGFGFVAPLVTHPPPRRAGFRPRGAPLPNQSRGTRADRGGGGFFCELARWTGSRGHVARRARRQGVRAVPIRLLGFFWCPNSARFVLREQLLAFLSFELVVGFAELIECVISLCARSCRPPTQFSSRNRVPASGALPWGRFRSQLLQASDRWSTRYVRTTG
jgi:hypothetical protein